tara:strand:+ start:443 stop:832 length:390 start_codon:yes stop_codon:yes gene_type:complete
MLNYLEITKRIENLIHDSGLSASAFAEKIGVQRSSISHILSGRNKPSLDFLAKIVEVFPKTSLNELVYGDLSNTPHYSSQSSSLNPLEALKTPNSPKTDPNHIISDKIINADIIVLNPDGTYNKYSQKS